MNRDENAQFADCNPHKISHTMDMSAPQAAGLAWPLESSSFSLPMTEHVQVLNEERGTSMGTTWHCLGRHMCMWESPSSGASQAW
ncbi:hypothetical protein V8E53_003078, partial [Lactarius tabidus]